MEAHELRIGNWVEWFHPENGFVKCKVDIDILQTMTSEYFENSDTEVYPIPLTEEWLIKFGYKKNEYWVEDSRRFNFTIKGGVNLDPYKNNFVFVDTVLKYVHQLQNLFYCLTGNELTIKE